MKYISLLFLFLFISVISSFADNNDGWKFYSSYYSTNSVEESADKVYAVAQGALFSYGKEDNSIKQYTKGVGLSDMDISNIRYNKQTKSLLIVYSNQNIDIMEDQSTTNLPYLYTNTSLQNKQINSITLYNEYAYLSTAFGVMVVNMNKDKKEITDTYNLGVNTTSCTLANGYIYATTDKGLLKASLTDNLLDKGKWVGYDLPTSLFKGEDVSKIDLYKDKLCYLVKKKGVYYEDKGILVPLLNSSSVDTMSVVEDKLICISASQFHLFSDLSKQEQVTNVSIKDISSYKADKYWIAEGSKGLRGIEKSNAGGYATSTEAIILDGPRLNRAYKLLCNNNKLYMISGGRTGAGERLHNPGIMMTYDYNKWDYIDTAPVIDKFKISPRDYTNVIVNPNNPEDIYVASFGDGLFQFNKNEPINWYNSSNSPLQSAVSYSSKYINIDGLGYDKEGNLWMTNSEVNNTIKILDKDGGWHSLYIPELTTQYTVADGILITSTNKKWIHVPRSTPRIVVIESGSSLDEVIYEDFTTFIDQDKETFAPSAYICSAEDKDGYVWLGTSKGPVYFTNPDKAISNRDQLRCTRVKLTKKEGESDAYFFLDNIRINAITVDQGNRKWLGTNGNGVYVLDGDNQEVVHQFNTTNSPLMSDVILSIAINDETGEVFIGTDKGLVSYRGEAIAGKEDYADIYAFPNPVRPEFDDKVTITGLMQDSNIKITDINGNILYQTKSIGGQATWNCRNKSGNRVSTGIYLVLASTPDAAESVVTKIAVVK